MPKDMLLLLVALPLVHSPKNKKIHSRKVVLIASTFRRVHAGTPHITGQRVSFTDTSVKLVMDCI